PEEQLAEISRRIVTAVGHQVLKIDRTRGEDPEIHSKVITNVHDRQLNEATRPIKAESLSDLARRKARAVLQRAMVIADDVGRIAVPGPPAHQTVRWRETVPDRYPDGGRGHCAGRISDLKGEGKVPLVGGCSADEAGLWV